MKSTPHTFRLRTGDAARINELAAKLGWTRGAVIQAMLSECGKYGVAKWHQLRKETR